MRYVIALVSALVVGHLATMAVAGAQTPSPAEPHKLAEFFRGKASVRTVELYHIEHRGVLYGIRITLDYLLTMPVRDYARIEADNAELLDDLYSALGDTSVAPERSCRQSPLDVRWAIVLTYKDGKKDAVAIGADRPCVQLSSRDAALPASRARLLGFIQRTFPFTHADQDVRLEDGR